MMAEAAKALGVDVDFITPQSFRTIAMPSYPDLRLALPGPATIARLIEAAGLPAAEIVYVGDRVDNDALPASRAGLVSVFLRRGPWGVIQAGWPDAVHADLCIESLDELSDAFRRLPSATGGGR